MSIEQSVDSQLIEQTKQQIRALVAEIAQLSKSDMTPEAFYGEFLPRIVSALAAVGGAVWTMNAEGQLALQYQVNLQETQLRENENQAQHSRLLYKALAGGEGLLVPPHSGPGELQQVGEETPVANPTDFLLVLGLLKIDVEAIGIIEIFQRAEAGPNTQKGYLRFLMQMCDLAGEFLKSHKLRHFSDRQTLWTQLEDFARAVHASLDPRETAYTIANEGRRLIDCDRVSVAIRSGKHCNIEAVSGQDLFDKRSNTIRLLNKLASAAVATGEAVWYAGDTRDMPPQVEDAVQEYVDESHSKTVAVLPLQRPAPPEEDDRNKRIEPEEPIGALIVEQIEDSRVTDSLMQRADVVCRHSSTALANAIEHQNLFLMPLWRSLGKLSWVVHARTLPKTLSITGGVLAVLLVVALWPARFTLEAPGTLEPALRQDVFAGVDGVVQEMHPDCDHGKTVKKDESLLLLRNTDLEVALSDVQGQRMAANERLFAVQRSLVEEKKLSIDDRNRLSGEQAELKQKLETLDAQWVLYKSKQAELDVKSPINGIVITWDLRNRLVHRPVQRGQVLLRVADPSGPWQLELKMPEKRMGHLIAMQQTLYDQSRERLRELLRESIAAKLSKAAAENQPVAQEQTPPEGQTAVQEKPPIEGEKPAEEKAKLEGEVTSEEKATPETEPTLEEKIDAAVEKELGSVPDEKLHDRILAEFRTRLIDRVQQILGNVTDEAARTKLGEVLRDESYEGVWAKLQSVLPEITDETLLAQLQEITHEELDDQLQVSYILATEPGITRYGRVKEIHRSAEVIPDEGNTVLVKVAIDKSELPDLRPGASVTAQVDCGRSIMGYVLLHDVITFIQSRILFRYF